MVRAGTTCTLYAFSRTVQSGLSSVESAQHVLCNKHLAWQDYSETQVMILNSQITLQLISTSHGQAVQYKYRLYEAKRDCTPNE